MASIGNGHIEGNRRELEELITKFEYGTLTTRGEDGHFHSRPMALQKKRLSSGELWFVTSKSTQKVHDLEVDDHCAVSFCGAGPSASYVSVCGHAELVEDRELIRQLWSPSWNAWFPEGPEAKDIELIKVMPDHAEYVHPETGRLQVLFTMVKNIVTHQRSEPAAKKEVDLRH